jgi:hypothetical protein
VDLDRFAADAPADDAPADCRVCLVATQPDTFERCRDGFYPSPRSYERTRREFDYMAFYRTAPVSAVTHYAPVTGRVEQTRGDPGPMTEADWAALIDPFSEERVVVVFELGDLVPLATPVANDANGVRGAWYTTVGGLREATALSDLRE